MADDELSKLRHELQESIASFDELSSSSAAVEKELNDEVDSLTKANNALKQELTEHKQRVVDLSKRLVDASAETEGVRSELRAEKSTVSSLRETVVALETKVTQLDNALRASEAQAQRLELKFDEQLELAAVAKCELEETKKDLAELKQRTKLLMEEQQGPQVSNDELAKAKKEAAFTRQLLKELVQSLSKGSLTIPSASEMLSVASASE
jgi:chromosome segregation ATPase